jgi:hypothetical protein
MTTSEQTDQLWPAFAAAYKAIGSVQADAHNEPDGFRYATIDAIGSAVRKAAGEHDIIVVQRPEVLYAAEQIAMLVRVLVRVVHAKSGQWMEPEQLTVPVALPRDARAVGEAITYARKYQLASVFGVTVGMGDVDAPAAREDRKRDYVEMGHAIIREVTRAGGLSSVLELVPEWESMSMAQRLVIARALPDAPEGPVL